MRSLILSKLHFPVQKIFYLPPKPTGNEDGATGGPLLRRNHGWWAWSLSEEIKQGREKKGAGGRGAPQPGRVPSVSCAPRIHCHDQTASSSVPPFLPSTERLSHILKPVTFFPIPQGRLF